MINQDTSAGTKVEIKAKEASMKIIALPIFKYLVIFANFDRWVPKFLNERCSWKMKINKTTEQKEAGNHMT